MQWAAQVALHDDRDIRLEEPLNHSRNGRSLISSMSGVSRLLSKRERHRDHKSHGLAETHRSSIYSTKDSPYQSNRGSVLVSNKDSVQLSIDPAPPVEFYGLFNDTGKPPSKDENHKIRSLEQKVAKSKGVVVNEGHCLWALRSALARGDENAAFDLLVAMTNASEGIVTPFDPDVTMVGAVNRQAVTCYLDATLFSMFSRLDSFEPMLYNTFEDPARSKLAFLIRLWVNLLRTGKLITTDITKILQEAISACGWDDAEKLRQQDASEAFVFITEKLNLPLLTLKMDIYHTGRQDNDDHKYINERLLEVAIPSPGPDQASAEVKLEDCLEEYFNNRIEVKRYMLERRNTVGSMGSFDSRAKGASVHVEAVELDLETPQSPVSPAASVVAGERPVNRRREPSIIQERFIPDKDSVAPTTATSTSPLENPRQSFGRLRKGSIRKEVVMPAWQFFSLIPWYTDSKSPSTDAQVADHFSSKRPILGVCLKRYGMTPAGKAFRLNTVVDIPIEIGLPHFIQDDHPTSDGPLFGSFKLSLQSVVCHRGNSVDSGHYISFVRIPTSKKGNQDEGDATRWLKFDDLGSPRVALTSIERALKEETAYLLFYQIVPVDGDPGNLTAGENPPSYASSEAQESTSNVSHTNGSLEPLKKSGSRESGSVLGSNRPSIDITTSNPSSDEASMHSQPLNRKQSQRRRLSANPFGSLDSGRRRKSADFSAFANSLGVGSNESSSLTAASKSERRKSAGFIFSGLKLGGSRDRAAGTGTTNLNGAGAGTSRESSVNHDRSSNELNRNTTNNSPHVLVEECELEEESKNNTNPDISDDTANGHTHSHGHTHNHAHNHSHRNGSESSCASNASEPHGNGLGLAVIETHPSRNHAVPVAAVAASSNGGTGAQGSRSQRKEKKLARAAAKSRGEKPDRECIVM